MNVLVISVHPDDETLGCGGTLLKHREAGDTLHWMIMTHPRRPIWSPETVKQKALEVKTVATAYGMKQILRLELPATELDTVPLADLLDSIRDGISQVRPNVVYLVHGGDVHSDHRIAYSAVMAVLKPFYMAELGVQRILSYETLSSTEAASPYSGETFVPTVFNDITPYVERKIEIMSFYKTEAHPFPSPRSAESIRALAGYRGATVAVPYAESFMLRRELM